MDSTTILDGGFLSMIVGLIAQYVPVLLGTVVVPILGKIKKRINKDRPLLWGFVSVVSSLIVYLGAGAGAELATGQEVVNSLNAVMTPVVTTLFHNWRKDKQKVALAAAPTT